MILIRAYQNGNMVDEVSLSSDKDRGAVLSSLSQYDVRVSTFTKQGWKHGKLIKAVTEPHR